MSPPYLDSVLYSVSPVFDKKTIILYSASVEVTYLYLKLKLVCHIQKYCAEATKIVPIKKTTIAEEKGCLVVIC